MCRITQSHIAVNNLDEFAHLPGALTSLIITANTSDDVGFVTLDLTRFHDLKELHVKAGSLKNVRDLKLHGLKKLKTIVIGEDSFSSSVDGTFEMRYCSISEELIIHDGSFTNWKEFIISDCSIQGILIGRDCFLYYEYCVFNSRMTVNANNV